MLTSRIDDPRYGAQSLPEDTLYQIKTKFCRPGETEADAIFRVWIEEGTSPHTIAEKLETSLARVRFIVAYLGLHEPCGLPTRQLVQKIADYAEQGYMVPEMARELGMKTSVIQDFAAKYDIELTEE